MNQKHQSAKFQGMASIQHTTALKGLLCGAAATALTLCATEETKALSFPDTNGHWALDAIDRWSDYGVITGDDTGMFNPDEPITRGEMAIMINQIMNFQITGSNIFTDLTQSWYITPVLKLNTAGLMYGDGSTVRPTDNITRQEAAVMLANAFHLDVLPTYESVIQTSYLDNLDIATWAKNSVGVIQSTGAMNAGVSAGVNSFYPSVDITRAEVAYALNVLAARFVNATESIKDTTIHGSVVINSSGVTLDTVRITGDLILAEGIFNGNIKLDNVQVDGNIIVRGGSSESIYLHDVTVGGRLEVSRKDAPTKVVISGSSKIPSIRISYDNVIDATELSDDGYIKNVYVTEDDADVTLTGTFGNVYNESPRGNITLAGKFDKVEMTVAGTVNDVTYGAGEQVDVSTIPSTSVDKVPNILFTYDFPSDAASANVSTGDISLDLETGDVEFLVYVSNLENCTILSDDDLAILVNDGSGIEIEVEKIDEAFGTYIYKVSFNLTKNVDTLGLTITLKVDEDAPDITIVKDFSACTEDDASAKVKITETLIDGDDVTLTVIVSNFVECRLSSIDKRAITIEDGYTASKYPSFTVTRADTTSDSIVAYQVAFTMDEDTTSMPLQLNFIDDTGADDYADIDLSINLNLPEYDDDEDKEASVTLVAESLKYSEEGTLGDLEGDEVYHFKLILSDFVDCEPYEDNYKTLTFTDEDEAYDYEVEKITIGKETYYYVEVAYASSIDSLEFDLNLVIEGYVESEEEEEEDVVSNVLIFEDMYVRYYDKDTGKLVNVVSDTTEIPEGATVYAHSYYDGRYVSMKSASATTSTTLGTTRTFIMGDEAVTLAYSAFDDDFGLTSDREIVTQINVVDKDGNTYDLADVFNLSLTRDGKASSITMSSDNQFTSLFGSVLDLSPVSGYTIDAISKIGYTTVSAVTECDGQFSLNKETSTLLDDNFFSVALMDWDTGDRTYNARLGALVKITVTISGEADGNDAPDEDDEVLDDTYLTGEEAATTLFGDLFDDDSAITLTDLEDTTFDVSELEDISSNVSSMSVTEATLAYDAIAKGTYEDDFSDLLLSTVSVEVESVAVLDEDDDIPGILTTIAKNLFDGDPECIELSDFVTSAKELGRSTDTEETYYALATYQDTETENCFEVVLEITLNASITDDSEDSTPAETVTLTITGDTSMVKGDTSTLVYTTSTPSNTEVTGTIAWSSDTPTVAMVDKDTGYMVTTGKGTAKITATWTETLDSDSTETPRTATDEFELTVVDAIVATVTGNVYDDTELTISLTDTKISVLDANSDAYTVVPDTVSLSGGDEVTITVPTTPDVSFTISGTLARYTTINVDKTGIVITLPKDFTDGDVILTYESTTSN